MRQYAPRDPEFEWFLGHLNDAVGSMPEPPVPNDLPGTVQITGLPRSGTTVLFQLLANTGAVGYPSNVMALFHRAPWVGARLQTHLAKSGATLSLESFAGRTREPLDPHEFGYFWRRVCGHSANTLVADLEPASGSDLRRELDLVASAFVAPVVYKNFLSLVHARRWQTEGMGFRHVLIRRSSHDVAASLVSARARLGYTATTPFGVTAPGFVAPPGSVEDVVVAQVHGLEEVVRTSGLLEDEGSLVVDYADVCSDPREVVASILSFVGADVSGLEKLPRQLPSAGGFDALDREKQRRLEKAMESLADEPGGRAPGEGDQ